MDTLQEGLAAARRVQAEVAAFGGYCEADRRADRVPRTPPPKKKSTDHHPPPRLFRACLTRGATIPDLEKKQ